MENPGGGGGGGGKGKLVIASGTPCGIGGGGNHVGAFCISGFCSGGLVGSTSAIHKRKRQKLKLWQCHLLFQEEGLRAFGYHLRS